MGIPQNLPRGGFRRRGAFLFPIFLFIPFDSFWLSGDLTDSGLGQAASLGGQSARPKSLRKCLRIWPRWPLAALLPHRGAFLFPIFLFIPFVSFWLSGDPAAAARQPPAGPPGGFPFSYFPIFLSIPFISYKSPQIPFDFGGGITRGTWATPPCWHKSYFST